MKYASAAILSISLIVGELHNFFAYDTHIQNWILKVYRPATIEWNVKYLTDEILPVMYIAAILLYRNNKGNRVVVRSFLFWAIIDIWLYFYNYKTAGYHQVYLWLAGCLILSYYGNDWFDKIFNHIKNWGKK